jgi:hypothetical protein
LCCTWYAATLARKAEGDVEVGIPDTDASPGVLLDVTLSSAALLAAAVSAAAPDDRGWHPWGIADRSGFAAMGADEILVHGSDLAAALGVKYQPPASLCRSVLRRLFPWAPADVSDPWKALLWANGRASLGGAPEPDEYWRWHCAPLDTWDGTVHRK